MYLGRPEGVTSNLCQHHAVGRVLEGRWSMTHHYTLTIIHCTNIYDNRQKAGHINLFICNLLTRQSTHTDIVNPVQIILM